jgi:hypothetical protein
VAASAAIKVNAEIEIKTKTIIFPISIDNPATPFSPKNKATKAKTKNSTAVLINLTSKGTI